MQQLNLKIVSLSLTQAANLPPVSTTLAKLVEKFAAGVVDIGGKFGTGVVDTGGAPCEYLREFPKKFETVLMEYSAAGGKLIHEKKTRSKKSRDTGPLTHA
jgi:hypothetical protein